MSDVTIDNLQAAKNGDEVVNLLDKGGVELSTADDARLVAAMKSDFTSKRRAVVRTMRSAKFFKADGSVDGSVVSQPDKVSQWFTKLMGELEPAKPTDTGDEPEEGEADVGSKRNTKAAKSYDNWIHAALGTGIITEIAAELGASRIDDMFSNDDRDRGGRRPAAATADVLEAEAIVVGRASKSLISRTMSGIGTALIIGLVVLGILAILVVGLIVFWPITIPLAFACWLLFRWLDRRAHRNMLRWVGEDLPTVLRLSRVKWTEFCDPAQPEKWQKVYQLAMRHLDSKLPWHDSREDRIDNLLFEITARINKYYREDGKTDAENLAKAAKAMDAPDARVPEAVYRLDLEDKGGGTSRFDQFWEQLKSA